MLYDLVVYAAILFGPDIIAQNLGIPASIYQIETELIFVIPPSILMSWFMHRPDRAKTAAGLGLPRPARSILGIFAWMRTVPAIPALLAYIVFGLFNVAQTGPGLVSGAGVYGVELAPTRIRSVAQSITVIGGRIGAAISGFVFPLLNAAASASSGPSRAWRCSRWPAAIASQLLVPETSSRSLEEINLERAPVAQGDGRIAVRRRSADHGCSAARFAAPFGREGRRRTATARRLLQRGLSRGE